MSFLVLEQANRDLENDMRAALAQSPVTSQPQASRRTIPSASRR